MTDMSKTRLRYINDKQCQQRAINYQTEFQAAMRRLSIDYAGSAEESKDYLYTGLTYKSENLKSQERNDFINSRISDYGVGVYELI